MKERLTFSLCLIMSPSCGIYHANSEWVSVDGSIVLWMRDALKLIGCWYILQTVALNTDQLDAAGGYGSSGVPSVCGDSITISYGGKTAVATIQDECPTVRSTRILYRQRPTLTDRLSPSALTEVLIFPRDCFRTLPTKVLEFVSPPLMNLQV